MKGDSLRVYLPAGLLRPIREYVLPLVALAFVLLVPERWMLFWVIIGGQAHFLMAYLYQYRGKKITRTYGVVACVLLALAVLLYSFLPNPFPVAFILVTLFFAAHFAFDELTLHDESWDWLRGTTVLGFVLLTIVLNLVELIPVLRPLAIALIVATVIGITVRLLSRHWPSRTERYLWYLLLLLVVFAFFRADTPLATIIMFTSVLHYLNWLIGYGVRVQGKPHARKYWKETITFALVCTCLAFVYRMSGDTLFSWLFTPMYYYYGAVMHIALSWTISLVAWMAFKKASATEAPV